jgi:hypothetical protein
MNTRLTLSPVEGATVQGPKVKLDVEVANSLDQKTTYVHAGKAPHGLREIKFAPGQHTITVVMDNSVHQALAMHEPVSMTFTVK